MDELQMNVVKCNAAAVMNEEREYLAQLRTEARGKPHNSPRAQDYRRQLQRAQDFHNALGSLLSRLDGNLAPALVLDLYPQE